MIGLLSASSAQRLRRSRSQMPSCIAGRPAGAGRVSLEGPRRHGSGHFRGSQQGRWRQPARRTHPGEAWRFFCLHLRCGLH
eukprot:291669-Pyramimonas_sp.AAC.1